MSNERPHLHKNVTPIFLYCFTFLAMQLPNRLPLWPLVVLCKDSYRLLSSPMILNESEVDRDPANHLCIASGIIKRVVIETTGVCDITTLRLSGM